ncbi:MAG: prepilin-type N-terminal cleavage/methylation domain-containing protein [Candidatus Omnitrophota bacterium]
MKNKGFSLVELLLAAAILAFVLTGLLFLFAQCSLLNEANRNKSTAVSHAEYILEDLRSAGFTGLEIKIANGEWNLGLASLQSDPFNFTALVAESIETSVFQSGNPLGVSVVVSWQDRNKKNRSIELRTYLTDY